MLTRQKLPSWIEEQAASLCTMSQSLSNGPGEFAFPASICEGVDAVFLSLLHAIESGDDGLRIIAKTLVCGERSAKACPFSL